MSEPTGPIKLSEAIQRRLRVLLPLSPYLWFIPVAMIIRAAEGSAWGEIGVPLSSMAIALFSLEFIHKESILRIAGNSIGRPTSLKWAYLVTSLVFLAIPVYLALTVALTEPDLIYQVIGAPVSEEIFIRMYLLGFYVKGRTSDKRYKKVAFGASNAAFVLMHFVPRGKICSDVGEIS